MKYLEDYRMDSRGLLEFGPGTVHAEPKIFYLNGYRDMFTDLLTEEDVPNRMLYALYEKNALEQDLDTFNRYDLNYNLKMVLPGLIGREYVKTIPHFHPVDETTGETFPEVHEVLAGEGVLLLQKNTLTGDRVNQSTAVEFSAGDQIYLKSGFGHTTINTGDQPVLIASLIRRRSETSFSSFQEKKGCLYSLIRTEEGYSEYVRNPHYPTAVGLDILPARALDNPLYSPEGLYGAFIRDPERFSVLWK